MQVFFYDLISYNSICSLQEKEVSNLFMKIIFPKVISFITINVATKDVKTIIDFVIKTCMIISCFTTKLNFIRLFNHLIFIFWILDHLVEMGIQSKNQAIYTLNQMPEINSMYQVGLMKKEVEKRIQLWGA